MKGCGSKVWKAMIKTYEVRRSKSKAVEREKAMPACCGRHCQRQHGGRICKSVGSTRRRTRFGAKSSVSHLQLTDYCIADRVDQLEHLQLELDIFPTIQACFTRGTFSGHSKHSCRPPTFLYQPSIYFPSSKFYPATLRMNHLPQAWGRVRRTACLTP